MADAVPEFNDVEQKSEDVKAEVPEKKIEDIDSVVVQKIVKQCEFYYGDLNLSRDRFLQEQVKLDDGWVPIEVMLRFNRLKSICDDAAVVAAALGLSSLIEVHADRTKIRRKPSRPLHSISKETVDEQKMRSVYAKGFPADAVLDQLQEFFEKFGTTDLIVMRKDKKKMFKGSCFVVFQKKENAMQFVTEPNLKYNDNLLLREFKHDYYARKANERKTNQEERQKEKRELQEKEDREFASKEIVLGSLLLITNMPTTTSIEEIRLLLSKYGNVKWIDFEKRCPTPEAIIRFAEENSAKAVLEKIQEEAGGRLVFKDVELNLSILEGEAEQEHWKNLLRAKKDRAVKGRKGFGHKHGSHGRSTYKRNRGEGGRDGPMKKQKVEDDGENGNSNEGDSD